MENYELKRHQKSDVIKWIIAFALIFVLLAGLIGTWVVLFEDDAPEEESPAQTETVVTDGEGNPMESGKVYAMPANMVFATTAAEQSNASDGITLKATVMPEAEDNQLVDWSVAFANPSSAWASGKNVTDYVTVTPSADGATTATVQCKKAFGERINVIVTSRLNEYAKAECVLDYARRITDLAIWSFKFGDRLGDFGSNEILVDLVLPSFDELLTENDNLWAGDYGIFNVGAVSVTPEDEADPEQAWADESAATTFRFSDYTIKDNLVIVATDQLDNEYYAPYEVELDVNDDFIGVMYNFAFLFTDGRPVSNAEIWGNNCNGFAMGNNPFSMLQHAHDENGFMSGISMLTEERYNRFVVDLVTWLQENPDTPIATYTYSFEGKYSSFSKTFTFRFNPESVKMPVYGINMDQETAVF